MDVNLHYSIHLGKVLVPTFLAVTVFLHRKALSQRPLYNFDRKWIRTVFDNLNHFKLYVEKLFYHEIVLYIY